MDVPEKKMQVRTGTMKDLIAKARAAGIKGYTRMKKAQLETVLNTKIPEAKKDADSIKDSPKVATIVAPEATQTHVSTVPVASEASPVVASEASPMVAHDATMVASEATKVAPEATKEQKSVHFEPKDESEKLDLKLNSMTMPDLKLACKKLNIKVSKYNSEIRIVSLYPRIGRS